MPRQPSTGTTRGAPGTPSARRVAGSSPQWVAEPGPGVRFESEGALKVLFAENGTKQQLLATIDSMRHDALADVARVVDTLEYLLTEGPPYPNRIHQSVLVMDLVLRITTAVAEWADLTEQRVDDWPDLKPDDAMRAAAMDLVSELRTRAAHRRATRRPSAGGQRGHRVRACARAWSCPGPALLVALFSFDDVLPLSGGWP